MDEWILLSIKPRFARAILSGEKTVELRRTMPRARVGTRVLVYSSTPEKALIGTAIVADVQKGTRSGIWRRFGRAAAVSRREFMTYFDGAGRAVAIVLAKPSPLPEPVPLAELRRRAPGFHPPQSYRYVPAPDGAAMAKAWG
jgi:predicted transcriptional regulator